MKPTKWKGYYKILLCAVLACVFHSSVYSVPPGYISPYNGFCDENTTEDEYVDTFVASNLGTPPNFSPNTFENIVHTVNIETLHWANFPFNKTDQSKWSDTWGVCAFFKDPLGGLTPVGEEEVIDDLQDMINWESVTRSWSGPDHWRLIFVKEVNWCAGVADVNWLGCTFANEKISFVEADKGEKLAMHEWGHTNDCWTCGVGTYIWPPIQNPQRPDYSFHYGPYRNQQGVIIGWPDFLNLNVMTPDVSVAGLDGDMNFKFNDYPWIEPNWWDSKRWNENF